MRVHCLAVAALFTAQAPAFAIAVNVSGFNNGDPQSVTTSGTVGYSGAAGEFIGTVTSDEDLSKSNTNSLNAGSSFTAYCAELTQQFSFNTPYDYTLVSGAGYFSGQKSFDLSRLFTGAQGFVTDATTSAAFQAAVWEIIYETGSSYNLGAGAFLATPQNPQDTASFAAFTQINGILGDLSSFDASYSIQVLTNNLSQDFVIATVPEPGTWAMIVAGLGVMGLLARRRKTGSIAAVAFGQ